MPSTVFDRLSVLADPTRSRLLLLVDSRELSVSELCTAVQLPQSTVSRHLKVLADEGWVGWRVDGASRHYRLASPLEADALALWQTVRPSLISTSAAMADAQRLPAVLATRAARSRQFFATAADRWESVRSDLFGASADLALLGLLDERWTVGDLGCGSGVITAALAPYVHRVIAVDASTEMLAAAKVRTAGTSNVELRTGQLEQLPIATGELDAAVLFLVLHYLAEPAAAVRQAAVALRPGGRLLVVDMAPHDRVDYGEQMGHLWLGFDRDEMSGWLSSAGLVAPRFVDVPVDAAAKGPKLFAVTARRRDLHDTNEGN